MKIFIDQLDYIKNIYSLKDYLKKKRPTEMFVIYNYKEYIKSYYKSKREKTNN